METQKEISENVDKESVFNKKLVCINYPGIVKNVEKMEETLGGIDSIEQVDYF